MNIHILKVYTDTKALEKKQFTDLSLILLHTHPNYIHVSK